MQHEPSRGFGDSNVPTQLHRGDASEAGDFQLEGHGPLVELDVAMGQRYSSSDAEILAAVGAPVGQRFPFGDVAGLTGAAMSAAQFAIPQSAFKTLGGRFLIGHISISCMTVMPSR